MKKSVILTLLALTSAPDLTHGEIRINNTQASGSGIPSRMWSDQMSEVKLNPEGSEDTSAIIYGPCFPSSRLPQERIES